MDYIMLHKKFIGIIGIIVVFFLLAVFILSGKTNTVSNQPTALPTPTPFQGITTTFPTIIPTPVIQAETKGPTIPAFIFLNEPTLPNQAKVYKVTTYTINEEQALLVANSFSFNTNPQRVEAQNDSSLLWKTQDNGQELFVSLMTGYIQYSNNYRQGKPDIDSAPLATISSSSQALTLAQTYLRQKNLLHPDLFSDQKKVQLYTGDNEVSQTQDIASDTLFRVSFERKLDGLPVYTQYGNTTIVDIWLDAFKTIKKLNYQYPLLFSNSQTYQLIDYAQAKNNLISGNGIIVNQGNVEKFSTNIPETPKTVTITNVTLAYLDDKTSGFILPIFVFKGKAKNDATEEKDIIIYLPAINK